MIVMITFRRIINKRLTGNVHKNVAIFSMLYMLGTLAVHK